MGGIAPVCGSWRSRQGRVGAPAGEEPGQAGVSGRCETGRRSRRVLVAGSHGAGARASRAAEGGHVACQACARRRGRARFLTVRSP